MTGAIVLVGPASPRQLARWLSGTDRERALELPGLGGSALTGLIEAFLETGNSVELVTLAKEIEEGTLVFEGSQLRILAGPYRRRARERGRDLMRQERRRVRELLLQTSGPVVNAHWPYEFALGALPSRARPVIVSLHDAPLTVLRHDLDPYRAVSLAAAVATRCHRIALTAVSSYTAAKWRRQMLDRRSIRVIPNVVPIPSAETGSAAKSRSPVILEIASDSPLKNVAALIRAMPAILATHSEAQLILAGPGLGSGSRSHELAERLGVAGKIEFLGEIERAELDPLFRRATVFAHASREESFGMSLAEAMSYGLPVVGGRNAGGVASLLDGGRAGVLTDTGRPAAIAAAISSLLEDRGRRESLGESARRRVLSHFSAPAVAGAYLDVYERAARR